MKNQLFSRWNRKHRIGMSAAFLSLVMLLAAFFVACDKESPVSVENQTSPKKQNEQTEDRSDDNVQIISLATAKYSYQGKLLDKEGMQKAFKNSQPYIMFTGTGLPDANVVYVFDSEADFRVWTKNTQFANGFAERSLVQEHGDNKSLTKSADGQIMASSGGGATLYNATFMGKNRYYSAQKDFSHLGSFSYMTSSLQVHCAKANSPVSCRLYDEKGKFLLWIYNSKAENSFGIDLHGEPSNNAAQFVEVYYGL